LKKLNEDLSDIVQEFVQQKLQGVLGESFLKIAKNAKPGSTDGSFLADALERKTKELFAKALFKVLTRKNKDA